MTTIYKYPLVITDQQTVVMPKSARLLSAAVVRGEVVVYAMVDTDQPGDPRTFWIIGTGHDVPYHLYAEAITKFIGTVVVYGEQL